MEQLKQEQQLARKGKCDITVHNPNSNLQTAKYLAEIILEDLKKGQSKGKDDSL